MKNHRNNDYINIPNEHINGLPVSNTSLAKISKFAKSRSLDILIRGETGTGKTHLAKAIHELSGRPGAFIAINSPELEPSLWRSELFGYEAGAFTGADKQKIGKFELADKGIMFFDEIGDVSLELQAALLKVLEEKTFYRIGGIEPISVDVKILFATNRNLEELVKQQKVREDFLMRIQCAEIPLHPLRERKNDIPTLVWDFIKKYSSAERKTISKISEAAMKKIAQHSWPGNIRELENTIKKAVILADDGIEEEDIFIQQETLQEDPYYEFLDNFLLKTPTKDLIAIQKKVRVQHAISLSANKSDAAKKLQISRQHFFRLEKQIASYSDQINRSELKTA